MRKNLGKKPLIYPQPVLMIGTYDENGNPDIMNAAWGGVGDDTQVFLCLSPDHKTTKNLLANKCFTVSMAVEGFEKECDYLGIVSGNDTPDKVAKSGLHVHKSETVNAPVIDELPLCLECELISYEPEHCHLFGEIVGTSVDESILTDGKTDISKLKPLIFDIEKHGYYAVGTKVEDAFKCGLKIKNKQAPDLNFRYATREDIPLILEFVRELARYEKMEDQVVGTPELYNEWLFEKKKAEVIFALEGGKEVGFALFFHNFSTFLGRAGLYLEDLYVKPEYRGKGYGKGLITRLAQIAVERGCGRFEWWCLDWNTPSIDFYKSLGAVPMDEWTVYRIAGDTLKQFL